jgi:hypothetical protein
LQSLDAVEQPDLVISSSDGTLADVADLLSATVGIDLDTGADVRALKAAITLDGEAESGAPLVVVGSEAHRVYEELQEFAVIAVTARPPAGRPAPVALVGVHGFSDIVGARDSTFPMQSIDDWGIDDVMGLAVDLASRQGRAIAALVDLAVLDPAFDDHGTIPGGLDMRRLLRAARLCGRRPEIAAAGFVRAGSDQNLVHAILSFCAGLALR